MWRNSALVVDYTFQIFGIGHLLLERSYSTLQLVDAPLTRIIPLTRVRSSHWAA